MKRLTLIVIFVLTLIGIGLTVSAIDGSRPRRTNESVFARTCKQPAGWSSRRRDVAVINPGLRQSLDCLKWLELGTRLSLVPWWSSNRTVFARMVPSLAAFSSLRMRTATQSGDGTLDTWSPPSIPHFHHRLQVAPGLSMGTSASAAAAPATSTTTVQPITTSRHGESPTCPMGTPRFSSTRRSGSIEGHGYRVCEAGLMEQRK